MSYYELGAYPTFADHPYPWETGPTGFKPRRLNLETGQYEEVEWPWTLPQPIGSDSGLWGWIWWQENPLFGIGGPRYFYYTIGGEGR